MKFKLIENEDFDVDGEIRDTYELYLHLNKFPEWSLSTYKRMLDGINAIKSAAKTNGYKTLCVMIPADEKLYKFELMMGFEPVQRYKLQGCFERKEFILMKQAV